jgi:hypothetical protein
MRRALSIALLGAAGLWTTSIATPAGAQRIAVEALVDGEMWKTDDGSRLLARNHGRPAPQGRVHAWLAYGLTQNLELAGVAMGATGYAEAERAKASLELLELRYTPHQSFGIRIGKLLSPMGTFGARHFSNVNPLIGEPDLYPPLYPWGAMVSGVAGPFDYRAGAVSLPTVNPRYSPEAGHRLRPVGGAGVSVGPSFHLGASITHGPYLGPAVATLLPSGASWQDYGQTVSAADLRFSFGYFETRAEAAWSSYEVPSRSEPVHGFGWYDEIRVTLSPRLFAAVRYEDFKYAFIGAFPPNRWLGAETLQRNAELGVGYRKTESALLKVSYRRDFWPGESRPGAPLFPDGSALAVQMSYHLDISEMLTRKY